MKRVNILDWALTVEFLEAVFHQRVVMSDIVDYCPKAVDATLDNLTHAERERESDLLMDLEKLTHHLAMFHD